TRTAMSACGRNIRGPRTRPIRPRHADIIAAVRKAGGSVSLISDGDVAGVIHTAEPDKTGIDIYLGIGGAPEGSARRSGAPLHRRPDAVPADPPHTGTPRTLHQDGHQRSAQEV